MPARVLKLGIAGISAVALFLSFRGTSASDCACRRAQLSSARCDAFYETYHTQPIWFRGGVDNPAVAQLIAILQRAPFDGFAAGPQLALQVQAAAAQAHSGNAADMAAAERALSTAWVQYVQAVKRPTTGMIYAYPVLSRRVRAPTKFS